MSLRETSRIESTGGARFRLDRTVLVEVPASRVEVGHQITPTSEVVSVVRDEESDSVTIDIADALGVYDTRGLSLSADSVVYQVEVPEPWEIEAHA